MVHTCAPPGPTPSSSVAQREPTLGTGVTEKVRCSAIPHRDHAGRIRHEGRVASACTWSSVIAGRRAGALAVMRHSALVTEPRQGQRSQLPPDQRPMCGT